MRSAATGNFSATNVNNISSHSELAAYSCAHLEPLVIHLMRRLSYSVTIQVLTILEPTPPLLIYKYASATTVVNIDRAVRHVDNRIDDLQVCVTIYCAPPPPPSMSHESHLPF